MLNMFIIWLLGDMAGALRAVTWLMRDADKAEKECKHLLNDIDFNSHSSTMSFKDFFTDRVVRKTILLSVTVQVCIAIVWVWTCCMDVALYAWRKKNDIDFNSHSFGMSFKDFFTDRVVRKPILLSVTVQVCIASVWVWTRCMDVALYARISSRIVLWGRPYCCQLLYRYVQQLNLCCIYI